jgi:hypothetical protein
MQVNDLIQRLREHCESGDGDTVVLCAEAADALAGLVADVERWQKQYESGMLGSEIERLTQERDEALAEARLLNIARNDWRASAGRLTRERDEALQRIEDWWGHEGVDVIKGDSE